MAEAQDQEPPAPKDEAHEGATESPHEGEPHGEGHSPADLAGVKPSHISEMTPRAIFVGLIVAGIMGASYPYIVLKLGFGPNVSVVAAFFGYMMLSAIALATRVLFGIQKAYNRWENNIVETCGTAAAQTAFMCVLLAAFEMLRDKKIGFDIKLTPLQSFVWLTCAGLLGTLVAVPLRQHYIVDEKLTYADGVAAGETLIVLDPEHAAGAADPELAAQGKKAAGALGIGALVSAFGFALREESFLLQWMPDGWSIGQRFALLLEPMKGAGEKLMLIFHGVRTVSLEASAWWVKQLQRTGVGISFGLLSLGSGALVGLRINVSMMLGATISWVVASLALPKLGWVLDAHTHEALANPSKKEILFWVMWPATGMMVCSGLTSLALKWRVLVKTFKSLAGAKVGGGDFPLRGVAVGVVVSATGLVIVQSVNLHIPAWITLVAIVLSLPLMLVGLRVLGETNWGPISALSNMMQGVFAALSPGNVAANMVASGTTGTIATSSEAIMQDYRAGRMVGTTPRNLTIMQLLGVPIGAAAVSWMYPYLSKTYGVVGDNPRLTSPISAKWAGFAEILKAGAKALPPHSMAALAIFSVLGIVFTVLEEKKSIKQFVPSPTGMGIGMLVPFSVISTMFLGGLMGTVWEKRDRKSADLYMTPLASGLIAGEAIVAVIVPVLAALGWIAVD
jgi:uncharacterized oligopeptide transporter (OPT) family protein